VTRHLATAPSLAPGSDVAVYLVLNDFGRFGRAYVETDDAQADARTIADNLLSGQYDKPLRVVAFNLAEWARDVSEDMAQIVIEQALAAGKTLPAATRTFIEQHTGEDVPCQLVAS
jgi:Tol biopolymer transport system component